MSTPTRPVTRSKERALAAATFAVPLYYLVTERTREVFVFTWSREWTVLVLVGATLYAGWLYSYARALPRWLTTLRSLAVALALSTFVGLAVVELALRSADDAPFAEADNSGRHAPDPDVGHVYVPNHTQTLSSREHTVEWHSNAQGVRAEHDYGPKPAGVLRVLCSGDSFTACDQVPYRESWPAVLEACLNQTLGAGAVEVVDAGFPGYGTVNEARWLAKFGAAFEPDIVLVATTPNDLSENQFPLQYTARDGAMTASTSTDADLARFEHRRSWWCLGGALERSLLAQRIERSSAYRRLRGRPAVNHVEAYMTAPNDKATRLFKLADSYMLEARDAAQKLGARFGIVVIPYSHQLHPLGPGLDPTNYGRHWERFGEQHAIPAVDALTAFLAHPAPKTLHWTEDTHCTAAGYALVAQEACRLLLEHREAFGLPAR